MQISLCRHQLIIHKQVVARERKHAGHDEIDLH